MNGHGIPREGGGSRFEAGLTRRQFLIAGLGVCGFFAFGGGALAAIAAGGGGGSVGGDGVSAPGDVAYAWYWYDTDPKNPPQGWTSEKAMDDFFIPGLSRSIGRTFDTTASNPSVTVGPKNSRQAIIQAGEVAIANAKRRAGTQRARIVGVGVCWTIARNSGGKWCTGVNLNAGQATYRQLFGEGSSGGGLAGTQELSAEAHWDSVIDRTLVNDALAGETWRAYIYRIGVADNPGANYRAVVVAAAESWPPQEKTVTVEKRWTGRYVANNMPDAISVHLRGSGGHRADATLTAANGWKHTWEGLPSDETYTVTEDVPVGFEVSYSHDGDDWVIVNELVPGYGSLKKAPSERSFVSGARR